MTNELLLGEGLPPGYRPDETSGDTMPLFVSYFRNENDNEAELALTTWGDLKEGLRQSKEREQKSGMAAFAPAAFDSSDGRASASGDTEFWRGQRGKANVAMISALVLDIEDKEGVSGCLTPDELLGTFPRAIWDYEFFAYSTFSNAVGKPCFRIILPFAFPFIVEQWREFGVEWEEAYVAAAGRLVGEAFWDQVVKDASRLYYLPSHRPGSQPWEAFNIGDGFLTAAELGAWVLWDRADRTDREASEGGRQPLPETRDDGGERPWASTATPVVAHPANRVSTDRLLQQALGKAVLGNRNTTGHFLAGQLRDNSYTLAEAEPVMREYHRLCPSVDHAYSEDEAMKSLRSAYSQPKREPWASTGTEAESEPRWTIRTMEDYRELQRGYLIEGVLPTNAYVVIFGAPNAGKSMLALSMMKAIATGVDWFGHPVQPGRVLWFAQEGECDIYPRERALEQYHGLQDCEKLCYIDDPINLSDPAMAREFSDWLGNNLPSRWGGQPPNVVVFDTLASAMQGDENDVEAFRAVNDNAKFIRKLWNCTVVAIHHSTKGNDEVMRGSSSLAGAIDMSACVRELGADKQEPKGVQFLCKKMRGARRFDPIHAKIIEHAGIGPLVVQGEAPVDGRGELQVVVLRALQAFGEAGFCVWMKASAARCAEGLPDQTISESRIKRVMQETVDAGLVTKNGEGRYDPYRLTAVGEVVLGSVEPSDEEPDSK